jgi:hypothetical protein
VLRELRLGAVITALVIALAVTVLLVTSYRSTENAPLRSYTCDNPQVIWGEYYCGNDVTIMGY